MQISHVVSEGYFGNQDSLALSSIYQNANITLINCKGCSWSYIVLTKLTSEMPIKQALYQEIFYCFAHFCTFKWHIKSRFNAFYFLSEGDVVVVWVTHLSAHLAAVWTLGVSEESVGAIRILWRLAIWDLRSYWASGRFSGWLGRKMVTSGEVGG